MSTNFLESIFSQAASWIVEADSLVITAGAGIGVDSGLPDFRGAGGFWKAYPALKPMGFDFYDIASPRAFDDKPQYAWGFYGHRLNLYRTTQPHEGFAHLLRWGNLKQKGYWVFTSNVDAQFQKAGFDARYIHECHGSIHHLQCTDMCHWDIWPADQFFPNVDEACCELTNSLPSCPHCGEVARPNILMFDDANWLSSRAGGQNIRQERWLSTVQKPVVVELGAGTVIPSARRFGEMLCKNHNARLIRINPDESQTEGDKQLSIPMGALEALTELAARLP